MLGEPSPPNPPRRVCQRPLGVFRSRDGMETLNLIRSSFTQLTSLTFIIAVLLLRHENSKSTRSRWCRRHLTIFQTRINVCQSRTIRLTCGQLHILIWHESSHFVVSLTSIALGFPHKTASAEPPTDADRTR